MNLIERLKNNKTLLNGSLFSLFSFINQGISFLLLILLASYIAPAEYGKLSLFNTIVQFLGYFVALSTQGYLSVSYFKRGKDYFKQDFSSICFISIIITVLFCFLTLVFGKWIALQADLPATFIWYAIIISFFGLYQHMWLDYNRIREKIGIYGAISCGSAILNLVLSLYLVIGAGQNWVGRVHAHLICACLFGVIGVVYFCHQKLLTKQLSWDNIKMVALWGIPLIPHLASVWIKQGGDRFIINHFHSVEDVGLFSFALNLTSIIIIIGSAFNSSNSVSIFKILANNDISNGDKRIQIKRQTRNISIITIVASIAVVLGVCVFIPLLLPRYNSSIPYFLILSLSGIGQCFYFLFCNYLFYFSKNKQIMYVTFFTAVFHLGLSIWLTRYSLFLTCTIYVITQIVITVLIYEKSRRVLRENLLEL